MCQEKSALISEQQQEGKTPILFFIVKKVGRRMMSGKRLTVTRDDKKNLEETADGSNGH